MGLGQTLMALAHFFGRESRDATGDGSPVLVVCPSSLVFNWLEESRRFFPEVQAEGLHGLTPAEREKKILDLQATKRDLARAVVEADSEEDALAALTVDELRGGCSRTELQPGDSAPARPGAPFQGAGQGTTDLQRCFASVLRAIVGQVLQIGDSRLAQLQDRDLVLEPGLLQALLPAWAMLQG